MVGNGEGNSGDGERGASAGDPALAAIDELLASERWDEALRALGPLRRTRPKDPEVWKRQGRALQGDGHLSEAKVAALLWIELEPESVEAHRFAADLDDQKEREARQRAEENRWAAEMRLAALPPSVLEQEAERSGIPLPPQSRKEKRKRKRAQRRKRKDKESDPGRPTAAGRRAGRRWTAGGGRTLLVVVLLVGGLVAWQWKDGWRPGRDRSGPLGQVAMLPPTIPLDRSADQLVVPPEPPATGSWSFIRVVDGEPVRWNPCRTIHYRVRLGSGPANGVQVVEQAVAEVSRRTGLRFAYDGPTDKVPQEADRQHETPAAGETNVEPVTIAWAGKQESDIWKSKPDEAAGFGGPSSIRWGDRAPENVSGIVVLEPGLGSPGDPGRVYYRILLHELGHLVGLGHVDAPTELMAPKASPAMSEGYGPGDLRGLWLLGASHGCS